MAALPPDLLRWIDAHFSPPEAKTACELLQAAVDHAGAVPEDRLLRCAAVGSRGELEKLRYLIGLLKVDSRDVIVFGEYDVVDDDKLVHVRNLGKPIE
jgi:hypothetical protein